ncbi:MAG: hypothetical protein AAFQ43_06355, partial [Bacteroidota bacterium]
MPVPTSLLALALLLGCHPSPEASGEAAPVAAADTLLASPPSTAEPFLPELFAESGWAFTPTLTPDRRTLYAVVWERPDLPASPETIQQLVTSRYVDGVWTPLAPVAETEGWRVDWPHVSPDGQTFWLSFTKPHAGHTGATDPPRSDDFDLWTARRLPDSPDGTARWAPLEPADAPDLNRPKTAANARIGYVHNETGPRITPDGSLLFWTERRDDGGGRRDLYLALPEASGDGFAAPTLLPAPVNSRANESGGVFLADGRTLVFASERAGGFGGSDLYASTRRDDGTWTE